jgi:hypothetical protein
MACHMCVLFLPVLSCSLLQEYEQAGKAYTNQELQKLRVYIKVLLYYIYKHMKRTNTAFLYTAHAAHQMALSMLLHRSH